jgi:hypothetical protein
MGETLGANGKRFGCFFTFELHLKVGINSQYLIQNP